MDYAYSEYTDSSPSPKEKLSASAQEHCEEHNDQLKSQEPSDPNCVVGDVRDVTSHRAGTFQHVEPSPHTSQHEALSQIKSRGKRKASGQ